MELEEILATPRSRLKASGLDFDRLKKDALERAASLGYEVVVIDFADPDNIYNPNGKGGWVDGVNMQEGKFYSSMRMLIVV